MVLGYWDMAASLVTSGAIDASSCFAANGEIVGTFSKIQPFLEQARAATQAPEFCRQIESVVLTRPDAPLATLTRRREASKRREGSHAARST